VDGLVREEWTNAQLATLPRDRARLPHRTGEALIVTDLAHTTPAGRAGRQRRMNDAAAQQRLLRAMGVQVPLEVIKALPPGGWIRFFPQRGEMGEEALPTG